MAIQVLTILVDDLDGTAAADETVRFAIDGTHYELDLTTVNAAQFRSAMNIYVGAARRLRYRH
ncbi:hypothetical protein GCM10027403_27400 [Arthrobacter tecti]